LNHKRARESPFWAEGRGNLSEGCDRFKLTALLHSRPATDCFRLDTDLTVISRLAKAPHQVQLPSAQTMEIRFATRPSNAGSGRGSYIAWRAATHERGKRRELQIRRDRLRRRKNPSTQSSRRNLVFHTLSCSTKVERSPIGHLDPLAMLSFAAKCKRQSRPSFSSEPRSQIRSLLTTQHELILMR